MRILQTALVVLAAGCAGSVSVPLEVQLQRLSACGVSLAPGATADDLQMWESRAQLEAEPFQGVVVALGAEQEEPPYTPLSHKLWLVDFERIEDHGDYAAIVQRLEIITGHVLGLTSIDDHVVIDDDEAWLVFSYRGETVRWEADVNDDWLDPQILARYDALLRASNTGVRLYIDTGGLGQEALVAAFSPAEHACFSQISAVQIVPLR